MVDQYLMRRLLLTVFLFFLSILVTLILMAFLFPVINPLMPETFVNKVLITFIASNLIATYIIFLSISFRYGIPFRGGDFWEWLAGDKVLGDSIKNGIIGASILIGIFIAIVFTTFAVRVLVQNFMQGLGIVAETDHLTSFLINVGPAYAITNIFFIIFFFKNKEIAIFKSAWTPLRLRFSNLSSTISLTCFLLVSVLICISIWAGLLIGTPNF